VLSSAGRETNNLVPGREYRFAYEVCFTQPARNVGFGCLVSTPTGISLAGAGTGLSKERRYPFVEPGETAHVEMNFLCTLGPGTYFLTVGCSGDLGDGRQYLSRVLDACMFRVLPEPNRIATGYFDMRIDPRIEVLRAWSGFVRR
jgi:lipopolysaccharide transport system ATP-binding protein